MRCLAGTLFAGVVALAGAKHVHAQTYTVLIRQMDGVESVPAHMTCQEERVCHGEMSVSFEGGHRRIFIRGMIAPLYASFKFRSDTRVLQCADMEFVTFQIGPRPVRAHDEVGICDPPSSAQINVQGLRHPVLTSFPPFAILRIDVRSRDAIDPPPNR